MGRRLANARRGLVRRSRVDVVGGISTLNGLCIGAFFLMVIGVLIITMPGASLMVAVPAATAPVTLLGLLAWSRWQIRRAELELWYSDSNSPPG
jgi:hypothetical protein